MFLCFACSKEVINFSKVDIITLTKKIDENSKLIIPKDMESGVKCSDYGDACRGGYKARVLNLEMIFVEFDSAEAADAMAIKIDAYTARNWLFDDVTGEPVLERFVVKAFDAKRPRAKLESAQ